MVSFKVLDNFQASIIVLLLIFIGPFVRAGRPGRLSWHWWSFEGRFISRLLYCVFQLFLLLPSNKKQYLTILIQRWNVMLIIIFRKVIGPRYFNTLILSFVRRFLLLRVEEINEKYLINKKDVMVFEKSLNSVIEQASKSWTGLERIYNIIAGDDGGQTKPFPWNRVATCTDTHLYATNTPWPSRAIYF